MKMVNTHTPNLPYLFFYYVHLHLSFLASFHYSFFFAPHHFNSYPTSSSPCLPCSSFPVEPPSLLLLFLLSSFSFYLFFFTLLSHLYFPVCSSVLSNCFFHLLLSFFSSSSFLSTLHHLLPSLSLSFLTHFHLIVF